MLLLIWRAAAALHIKSYRLVSLILTSTIISGSWLLFREGDLPFIGNNIFAGTNDLQLAAAFAATALLYSISLWLHAIVDQPRFEQFWTRNDVSRTVALTALTLTSFIGILLLRADV